MIGHQHESLSVKDTEISKLDINLCGLKILLHNVQSLNNKLLEMSLSFKFWGYKFRYSLFYRTLAKGKSTK